MKTKKTLAACYSFPGFRAGSRLTGVLGDPVARVITLVRRQKKSFVGCAARTIVDFMTGDAIGFGIWMPAGCGSTWILSTAGSGVVGAAP
jgi:hypothetical protein